MSIGPKVAVIGAAAAASAAVAGAVLGYERWWREPCVSWGATPAEIDRRMPGDDLLPEPDLLTTRAVSVSAPPSAIWPWLVQMGPGRGGVYTYDWLENLFGLGIHSVDVVLPEFQGLAVGDVQRLGANGPQLRVEVLDAERALVIRSLEGDWVWAFGLYPEPGRPPSAPLTRLVSRNRIATPAAGAPTRLFNRYVMEPGSLVMERKMLLGIRDRAERLAAQAESGGATKDRGVGGGTPSS
jgi:hypothetical protein